MTALAERVSPLRQLFVEECAAWREYFEATAHQPAARYEEMEPWAWARLGQRLRAIQARRLVLESPARRTDAAEGSSPAAGPGNDHEDDGA